MNARTRRTSVLAVAILVAGGARGQQVPVPNASFEEGKDAPAGWTLAVGKHAPPDWRGGGSGQWLRGEAAAGRRALAVTGTGRDNSTWLSAPIRVEPLAVYALRFRARSLGASGGTGVTGPTWCNRDLGLPPAQWTEYQSYFVTPSVLRANDTRLRLGQWHVRGTIAFDDVRLVRVLPVYTRRGGVTLGSGESVRGSEYHFLAPLGRGCANHSRPLARQRCHFHTNRWWLHADSEVVYRHEIAGRRQTRAKLDLSITWYAGGELLVQAGRDGRSWRTVGTLAGTGGRTFDLPAELLPASQVWVRLTARAAKDKADKDISLQVSRYAYTARLDGEAATMTGRTHFVAVPTCDPRLKVDVLGLGEALPGGGETNVLVARVTNAAGSPLRGTLRSETVGPDGTASASQRPLTLAPGEQTLRVPYRLERAGEHHLRATLSGEAALTLETTLHVAMLHDASYGERLPGSSAAAAVWWASSGWKVSRSRPAPKRAGKAVLIRAARNEVEAAQLVVRPASALRGFRAIPTDLAGPSGARIPAAAVEVLRVRYLHITQPTDRTGTVGFWPDPLPPLSKPLDVPAGRNQPLWVRVNVPRGIPGGVYAGAIVLTATGVGPKRPDAPAADQPAFAARVPLRVEVHGFDLPDRMTCQTAFGFSPGNVWRYQKVTDPAQRRAVLARYLASFSAHHISPYDPAPLDPFRVTWPKASDWQGGRRDRESPHAGKSCLKVADASEKASANAGYGRNIPIPPKGVRLRFGYRTAKAGQRFLVTLNHHDAAGKWMSGRNNDIRLVGDGTWQAFDRTITRFADGAKFVRLTLWPCLYSEAGTTTGTVWYDELSLTDAGTGKALVRGGDFEPIPPERLQPTFDFAAWDEAMTRAIDRYHFNSFRLRIQGMGGGTFHARSEPSLLGYGETTAEYQAAFTGYCRRLQDHLREKGWLDEAFVYWFDEPDPKDYAFVMNGFRKLRAAAPELTRMLTEQVEPALVGGPNLWCPVSPHYDHAKAEQRRQHGERFWWYVCCGPKAPYCTLFIDHPATELRVWLWQTWKRKIDGILVWQTNYWTSSAAYPDPARPQDPYADPMGWTSGYSTPKGTRRAWGNGDGRFIYPPEAAADAHPKRPVLDGPVDSIRWEMLRDGIEDYEYLALLRRLLEKHGGSLPRADRQRIAKLLTVPESVTKGMTDFTTDPAPIEARRHQLAKAIERLSKPAPARP